ncbi:MAG: 3-hydroxyacyl-CoA dehydrogenase/enoyl-CoA hydratase family protein, partial [bacterium]
MKKIAVIGAGVMGSQLAALFAGAGCEVELLDVVPGDAREDSDPSARSRLAIEALERVRRAKPPLLYQAGDIAGIRAGNLEDHIDRLCDCDWVLETIVERIDAKRALYDLLELVIPPSAVISSNTSSISLRALTQGRCDSFRCRFLITHFFNPPRHLKLVEFVKSEEIDQDAVAMLEGFLAGRLGKGVVMANDTPAFIANRIGAFYALDAMHLVAERGWPIEAVDAVLGRPAARPRQGIFRTLDMVGLDTVAYVAETVNKGCPDDRLRNRFKIPQYLQHMLVRGWTGTKSGRGFYTKVDGSVRALDPEALEYRARVNFYTPSLERAAETADPAERLKIVVFAEDQAGEIAWPSISRTLAYAAERIPEITDDLSAVDRAMRWGYGWELGPFEAWDALGVRDVASRLEAEGMRLPQIVERLLSSGKESFHDFSARDRSIFSIGHSKSVRSVLETNASASLLDLGDGVLACEFHSKMNALDRGTLEILASALDMLEGSGAGLVIANEGEHFSIGANLALVLGASARGEWAELDRLVRALQGLCMRIRFSPKPVVAAPFGRTLGGACEICIAAAARVAHIESYMGFVEPAVGLVPGGGGCKNMLLALERLDGGPMPKVSAAFELIALSRVSSSAREAVEMGFVSRCDRIVFDRDALLSEARA